MTTKELLRSAGRTAYELTSTYIDVGTPLSKAHALAAPAQQETKEINFRGAVDLNTFGASTLAFLKTTPAPQPQTAFGPHSTLLEDEDSYINAEHEAIVMGNNSNFSFEGHAVLCKYQEITAWLRIKKKADKYISDLSKEDLIILLKGDSEHDDRENTCV